MTEEEQSNPIDREVLAAIFASRVSLAKKTPEQAAADAKLEHAKVTAWIGSPSQKPKSFLWFCDSFELEPSAVRRAVAEARK
jgi:hypothetical protein